MIAWSKREAQETNKPFYINWFGKYFISWLLLNIFDDKKKYKKLSDKDMEKVGKSLEKSPIVKKLKKQGKTNKQIFNILVKDYDFWNKTGTDFEKTFGVKWPL